VLSSKEQPAEGSLHVENVGPLLAEDPMPLKGSSCGQGNRPAIAGIAPMPVGQ
jgi:hypothetical protein